FDARGNLITSGVTTVNPNPGAPLNSNQRLTPALFGATNNLTLDPTGQFGTIYVRVHGSTPNSINIYAFTNLQGLGSGVPGVSVVDKVGPQVTGVNYVDDPTTPEDESLINIFDPKPTAGPTPLVSSMEIHFTDNPLRAPGFLYPAIDPFLFNG